MSKSRPGLLPKYEDEEGMKEGSGKKGDEANGKEKGGDWTIETLNSVLRLISIHARNSE